MLSDADDRERADPRRHRLFAQHGLPASRHQIDAQAPARLGVVEFPALATRGTAGNDVAVTYWMNPLQGIDDDKPLFVSLNPPFEPDAGADFRQIHVRASAI